MKGAAGELSRKTWTEIEDPSLPERSVGCPALLALLTSSLPAAPENTLRRETPSVSEVGRENDRSRGAIECIKSEKRQVGERRKDVVSKNVLAGMCSSQRRSRNWGDGERTKQSVAVRDSPTYRKKEGRQVSTPRPRGG